MVFAKCAILHASQILRTLYYIYTFTSSVRSKGGTHT